MPTAQQQCLASYSNSGLGKTIQFFSLANLVTDFKRAWPDWTIYPGIKIAAFSAINKISQAIGNTEFWSITSTATAPASQVVAPTAAGIEGAESLGGRLAPLAIAGATAVDVGVSQTCGGANTPALMVNPIIVP